MHKTNNLLVTVAALVILISLGLTTASANDKQVVGNTKKPQIELTREEKAFLQSHPTIRFGTNANWEPSTIRGEDGVLTGFEVDLLEYINEVSGANIKLVTGQWADMVKKAKIREIDGLTTSAYTKARKDYFSFSSSYISTYFIVILPTDSTLSVKKLSDLNGKTVAILKNNAFGKALLLSYPDINIIEVDSELGTTKLLIQGQADASIGNTATYNNLLKQFQKLIKIEYVIEEKPLELLYSIRKDWPLLLSIVNKSLASLPPERYDSIFSRWFGFSLAEFSAGKKEERVPLTAQEQAWVKEHPEIRLGVDPTRQPVEFIDEKGEYQGVSSDYVRILNERLGLNMKIVPNLSWTQVMDAVPQRGVDVLPGAAKTSEREKHLNYSEPYSYIEWVIISRMDTPKISSLADLKGRVTAVNEGYASHYRIEKQYPGILLLLETTTLDALQSVIDGKAEAAVVEINTATLIIQGYRIHSLKIDQHVFQKEDPLSLAVRNDWPELLQILNKGLASITRDDSERIKQKWLAVPINIGFTKKDMLLIVLSVIAVMGIFLVLSLFWNRRLKKEIHERIKAEQALETSNSLMRIGESIAQLGFFERNWQTGEGHWSDGFYRLLGIENREVRTHAEFTKFIHKNDRQRVSAHIQDTLRAKTSMDIEFQLVQTDGTIVNIHGIGINSYDKEGNSLITRGTFQNISNRKQAEEEIKSLARFPDENPNPVLRIAKDGTILYANPASLPLLNLWECKVNQVLPDNWREITFDVASSGQVKEKDVECGDDTLSLTFAPVADTDYVNVYGLDITERKQAEEQVKASLKEKEVLLREVHHRVKNNMQVIMSLLRLQADSIDDEKYADLLKESQDRIKSMALIHEKFYQSENFADIDFDEYVRSLSTELFRSYGADPNKIALKTQIENVSLILDYAIPCGLIVNELISNSLKYAFPEGREGEIKVVFRSTDADELDLTVSDDGIGLPKDLDVRNTESLGLHLVTVLAEHQLGGKLDVRREKGTEFHLQFKPKGYKARI